MSLTDWVGSAGVALILGAYLMLQLDRIRPESVAYSLVNAVGAALILVSLAVDFNLPAALIESAWLLISLIGLARSLRRRSKPADESLNRR